MLTKIADWSSIAGAVLGAVGLLFSILAFRAAKRARQSAEDARRDIRVMAAGERLHHLTARAKDLSNYIDNENLAIAEFLAGDLRLEINSAIARWEFFDSRTQESFKKAAVLSEQVLQAIRRRRQDPAARAILLKKCDVILAILSGESSKIQSGIERRGAE
jgi:hypothetical protein